MRLNPVFKKEMKMMARTKQLPVLAVIFNAVLSVVILIVVYYIGRNFELRGTAPYTSMMSLYMIILSIEAALLGLFVPSSAGGSIAGERERQTLDILLSTKMTVSGIIRGKLMSCVSMAILLVFSSLPVLFVTLMYGGINFMDIYQSVIYVGFLIIFIGCVGVFCSCCFKKTTTATVTSFGILIFLTIGTLILVPLLNTTFMLGSDADSAAGTIVGCMAYLWLFNPLISYIYILYGQIMNMDTLQNELIYLGAAETVARHWVVFSLAAQIVFMVVLLILSAKYLNPLDEHFQAGAKFLKKNKKP